MEEIKMDKELSAKCIAVGKPLDDSALSLYIHQIGGQTVKGKIAVESLDAEVLKSLKQEDAIKIANGRWPSLRNQAAEDRAGVVFEKIYDRLPDLDNPRDNAAVTIMSYGLRQRAENRKLESEQNGLKIYQDIFGHLPETTEDWNVR